jgi:hypothetical protein
MIRFFMIMIFIKNAYHRVFVQDVLPDPGFRFDESSYRGPDFRILLILCNNVGCE